MQPVRRGMARLHTPIVFVVTVSRERNFLTLEFDPPLDIVYDELGDGVVNMLGQQSVLVLRGTRSLLAARFKLRAVNLDLPTLFGTTLKTHASPFALG
jgi:hypothetical protein